MSRCGPPNTAARLNGKVPAGGNGLPDLESLYKYVIERLKERESIAEILQKNPRTLLIFRLALNKSQREFLNLLNRKISQVTLVKYEGGKRRSMKKEIAEEISKILVQHVPEDFPSLEEIVETFKNFKSMQKRGRLTQERAKELNKKWQEKTTQKQRRLWGVKGAYKSLSVQRETYSERKIREILDNLGLPYERNKEIKYENVSLFPDFFLSLNKMPIIIEVTHKTHNLLVYAQSLCFRAIIYKNIFPNSFLISIVPEKMSYTGLELLKKFYDKIIFSERIDELEKFLRHLSQQT